MTTLLEQVASAHLELAQHSHTPTAAMRTVAKRGLRLARERQGVDEVAHAVGRRVASGRKLTDQHVEEMAAYHAAHDSQPTEDVEHMLWGGQPGAQWSSARIAAMDVSALGEEDAPTILTLEQDGRGISLEVFVRDGIGEPLQLDDEKKLVWAPILRSGMLATRPGPGGEKKHEPLVFVGGRASDPRKEIGLENLLDSFKKRAIQHVTIPTSHENGVLDNTGFIVDMKIVDSKSRPGEKVLVAAHDFKDPEVREKVRLGTIANRSCGIVYDYVNTETGETHDQVVDHVALTNRPWVTGMTPYGELDEAEFADREVIPMLLSERVEHLADTTDVPWDGSPSRFTDQQWARSCVLDRGPSVKSAKERYSEPIREPDGTVNANGVHAAAGRLSQVKGASLAQKKQAARKLLAAYRHLGETPPEDLRKLVGASTSLSERDRDALLLADVQWGATEPSMNDITSQVVAYLAEMRSDDDYYPEFTVLDVKAGTDPAALVRVDYGDPDGVRDAWVIPLELDGDKVHLSDFAKWTPVQKEWVTDEDAAQDKAEVSSLLHGQSLPLPGGLSEGHLHLAPLTSAERDALPASDFVFPDTREYPIDTEARARDALARGAANEKGKRLATIRRRVKARYPQIDVHLHQPYPKDQTNPLEGGAVKPTTSEVLERLGLSEDQRAALAPMLAENESLRANLAEVTKRSREEAVKNRVQELQSQGFTPGFCKTYEEIALGDDGLVAATLDLSDDNGAKTGVREYTATQIADRLISALPTDQSGRLALAAQANLLTSPIADRPPLDPADAARSQGDEVATSDEWLAQVSKIDPGLASEVERAFGLNLSAGAGAKGA